MEERITITYFWECEEFPEDIPEPLAKELRENAIDHIAAMILEGYTTSGELYDVVSVDIPNKKMPPDGYECTGGWGVITELI